MDSIEELRAKLRQLEEEKLRAEEEIRNTTLLEYLRAHDELVFTQFTVETDTETTSKGSLTNPAGRRCPLRLEPWEGFLEEQRAILGKVFSAFPADTRAFRSRHYLRTRGEVIRKKRVGDEVTLKEIMEDFLAEPVTLIVERLQGGVDIGFNVGEGIAFENRVNALGEESAQSPRTPNNKRPRPDQICAYRVDEGSTRTMAYFIEHKAPHKLTLPHLRLGLRRMNIYDEVVNRATVPIPEDKTARFQYHADKLAAIAVTQTFDDMIRAGLTYGCLTTGEAYVFLKVDWTDMTLYYHLAEPGPEVAAHSDNPLCCTAVSQVLAFTIKALDSQTTYHGQDDRKRAIENLNEWKVDWKTILQAIPQSERVAPPDSPAYKPTTYSDVDRSPYELRPTKGRAGRVACKAGPSSRDPSPEASDDGRGGAEPATPTPAQPRARRGLARRPRGSGDDSRGPSSKNRRYCSQNCLLGLVKGRDLDEECPNVALHRSKDTNRHPVDHEDWLRLLREQLRRTLDDGVVRLGKRGARGVVFQVSLLCYGYTFIGKATRAASVPELKHEADIYKHLRNSLQGAGVPVFLGAVDLQELEQTYYYESYESDVNIDHLVHFIFLSHGGSSLDEAEVSDGEKIKREVISSVRALHRHGVVHTDVRGANVLWDGKRVTLIDFEQAELVEPLRPALAPVVPNKRPWRADGKRSEITGKGLKKQEHLRMQEDIMEANRIFD